MDEFYNNKLKTQVQDPMLQNFMGWVQIRLPHVNKQLGYGKLHVAFKMLTPDQSVQKHCVNSVSITIIWVSILGNQPEKCHRHMFYCCKD